MEDYRLEQSGQEVQDILNGAAMQSDLTAETERATEAEQTLQGNIDAEATRAQGAEDTLQDNIDAEETRAKAAEKQNADDIDALEEKVPSGASASNKLATESYVDDSVATATATFRGTYNLVSDLHLTVNATEQQIATALALAISTADNNDYCFVQVPTSSETPTEIKEIDRYKFNGTAWSFEYKLNNSGFTAAQWAAINSGITSGDVTKLAALPTNAQLTALLAGKQDVLTFDNVPTQDSSRPVKSGGVYSAIDDEKTARETADSSMSSAIEAILLLIPSAATSLNKLADKDFVNSSIATASATFRGTYNLVTDLSLTVSATHAQIATALAGAVSDEDSNDYAFVQIPTSDATPTQIAKTERYKFNGTAWEYEYDLNNSGYTAAQWAAINSGITSALVTKLSALPTNAELTSALGVLTSSITTINQKIPSAASQSNQLVDTAAMESYIVQVLDVLTASFNVTSTDGHVTVSISQVDGKITSVAVSTSDIASAASLSLIAGRVTTAEGNISTNAADIANLQDAYAALTQSALVVVQPSDTWPVASPAASTIYRVVDRVNTTPQYYSDYMWNGSAMVLMATYNNAIDDVPTAGSNNLVKSGGVNRRLVQLDENTLKNTNGNVYKLNANYSTGLLLYSDGTIDNNQTGFRTSDYIILNDFLYLTYNNIFPSIAGGWQGVCFYDENKQFIPYRSGLPVAATLINHGIIDLSEIPNVKFVRFSNSSTELDINDSYVILSKTEDVSIIDYEDLSECIEVSKNIGTFDTQTYGDTSDNVGSNVVGGASDTIFTIENGYSAATGILSKITVNVDSAGDLICFVGLLDQRRNMVNQREFTISIPRPGLNTIDIHEKNIAIEEGEQIFIKTNISAGMVPRYKALSESINCQAMSSADGQDFKTFYEQSSTVFPHGISISLNYEVSIYEGRFAGGEEVSIIKNEVKNLAEQVNLSGVVYDSDGHPFKIVVVNNQLVPKSLLYRKVVALGNSLTDHPYNSSLGWLTKDYSMAATKKEMSWTSQLEKRLKTYYADAQVIPFNIYQWEQNPAINPSTIYKNDGISQNDIYLSEVLTSDVDCVIFRAGENGASTPQTQQDYEDGLTSLINYIKQRCPTADIVISSLMWHNTMKDTAFRNVANTFGLKYVDTGISGSQRETLGDFCLSYDDATYFPILNAGVAAHVNDYGFYIFANILINAFGMTPLNEQHIISVESSVTYYMNRVIGIKDGIITIQTYGNNAPTITVVDADSNVITVTHRNMSEYSLGSNPPTFCSTFIMPNSDVTVTIS